MNNSYKKVIAGIVSVAMTFGVTASVMPVYQSGVSAADSDVIIDTDFEDQDVSQFVNRGENDTTELSASDEHAHSGSYSLRASGRSQSWNGPAFRLDDKCEAGTQYLISAAVRGKYYTEATVSYQYSDSSGEAHYINLSNASGSDWVEFKDLKVSFSEDVTDVYVYFEGGTEDIYIDDFSVKAAPVVPIEEDIPSLKNVYSNYFKFGTATTTMELSPKSTKNLILKHFNSITLGNELKPDAILDKKATEELGDFDNPQVNLASARTILNFCRDNNISVRGHVLVWHSQTPDWFFKENFDNDGEWVSKETMLKRMENYIKNVFAAIEEEYPTVDFYAWDVVNEAWRDDGTHRMAGEQGSSGSENSAWVKVFGDNSFIPYAFEYARKYAPKNTKLYYNDYNEYIQGKTNAIYDMAMELKEKGLIDGIGMQAHLDTGFPTGAQFEAALAKFASTGLDVQITELDITTSDTSEAGLKQQAQLYSDVLDACVKYSDSVSAVVVWGTTDDQSWRASKSPLLFNADYTAKPCFYSIVDGIEIPEEPVTTTTASEPVIITSEPSVTTSEPSEVKERKYGDLDNNGLVEVTDLTYLSLYLVGSKTLSEDDLKYADVMFDDKINLADLAHLKQYVTNDPVVLGPVK